LVVEGTSEFIRFFNSCSFRNYFNNFESIFNFFFYFFWKINYLVLDRKETIIFTIPPPSNKYHNEGALSPPYATL